MEDLFAIRLEEIAALSARERHSIAAWRGAGTDMDLEADKVAALLDTVRVLDALGALIGGVAVGIHAGIPRATLDVDIAALSTADRKAIIDALQRDGFRLTGEFTHSVNFRHASGEPVQLAFDASFDPMVRRAEVRTASGNSVRLVTRDDLIAMKRQAAADPKRRKSQALRDQADIELLSGDVPDPDEGW